MAFGVDPSAYASQELSVFDDLLAALSRKLEVRDLLSAPHRGHLPDCPRMTRPSSSSWAKTGIRIYTPKPP
jgi:hypothetical protein